MNPGRRYTRWLKRFLFIYVAYLLIAYFMLGVGPMYATTHVGELTSQFRGIAMNFLFLFFVMAIQIVGLFWILTRGTTYTVYPNEYDHTFDDVRGQPAAVRSTKEVLRLFLGFKNFKQMGG